MHAWFSPVVVVGADGTNPAHPDTPRGSEGNDGTTANPPPAVVRDVHVGPDHNDRTPLYRRKPVHFEARQWNGDAAEAQEIIDWVNSRGGEAGHFVTGTDETSGFAVIWGDGEGWWNVGPGYWVIKLESGFHVYSSDEFNAEFEQVGP